MPVMLQDKIQELPEKTQKFYCLIVSKVIIESRKHPAHYESIWSKYLKNRIGTNYAEYVRQLEDWHIIEVNHAYSNFAESKFTKSYRLHPAAMESPKVRLNFKKKAQPRKDDSKLTDDVAKFVHQNLKRLTVRENLVPQTNQTDEVEAEEWAEDVFWGAFNVRYARKVKRLYHAAILMPKIARPNLLLKNDPGLPLFEYDVKSCMPVILLGATSDPAEKARLKTLLDADIYMTIAKEHGIKKDRETIKEDFLRFVNGGVNNYVHTFFSTHLPLLAKCVLQLRMKNNSDYGMAWFGQRVESKIMTDIVPRQLLDPVLKKSTLISNSNFPCALICGGESEGIFYIPMHDGWLGIEKDEQLIATIVRNEFLKRFDYHITLTKTELATGKETILGATTKRRRKAVSTVGMDENTKILRKSFRLMTTEQIKNAAKRIFKTNQSGETVLDKNALALLRTQGYKMKLAKELEEGDQKPPTD